MVVLPKPKPQQWLRIAGIAVTAAVALSGSYFFATPNPIKTEKLVDFILRHQWVLFGLIGVLLAPFVADAAGQLLAPITRMILSYWRPAQALVISTATSIPVGVCFVLLVAALLGAFRPIPPTVALDLPPPLRETSENPYLILFVHGWMGDSVETWRRFPELVMRDRRFDKCDIISVSYPTYIVRRSLSIPQLSQWLTRELQQRGCYPRYKKICVVAHSLGGIVAREIVIENRLHNVPDNIQKLVEIATPHRGAAVADLAKGIGIARAYIKDAARDSEYLSNLQDHWNWLKPRPATFAITSKGDQIVDELSATYQCDRHQVLAGWNHTELAKPDNEREDRYAVVMDEVLTALE
jgi:pimeloyl-ACP methyl ester carboxylesterase